MAIKVVRRKDPDSLMTLPTCFFSWLECKHCTGKNPLYNEREKNWSKYGLYTDYRSGIQKITFEKRNISQDKVM